MDFAGLERRIRAIEATRPASFRWGEVVAVDEGAGTARVKIHDADGMVSREVWLKAGKEGLLCPTLPTEYGGGGGDFGHSAIIAELDE